MDQHFSTYIKLLTNDDMCSVKNGQSAWSCVENVLKQS